MIKYKLFFLASVMMLSIGPAAHAQKKVNAKQPNIVWIMADDPAEQTRTAATSTEGIRV